MRLFGQGQAAGVPRFVCRISLLPRDQPGPPSSLHLGALLHWVNTSAALGKFGETCRWMQSEAAAGFWALQSARVRLMLET